MKHRSHEAEEKATTRAPVKTFFKALSLEVIVNYLAGVVQKIIDWVFRNWIVIVFPPIILALVAAIREFSRRTYPITGFQILVSTLIVAMLLGAALAAPRIRKWSLDRSGRYHKAHGFYWRLKDGALIGPYCPHCRKSIITDDKVVENLDQTIGDMFGETVVYRYSCGRCGREISLDMPLAKIRLKVHQEISHQSS